MGTKVLERAVDAWCKRISSENAGVDKVSKALARMFPIKEGNRLCGTFWWLMSSSRDMCCRLAT